MKIILFDDFTMNNGVEQFIENNKDSAFEDAIKRSGKHNVKRVKDGFIIPEIITKNPQPDYPKEVFDKAQAFYDEAIKRAENEREKRQSEIDDGYKKFSDMFVEALASAMKPQPVVVISPVKYEVDGFWIKAVIVDEQLKVEIEKLRRKFK